MALSVQTAPKSTGTRPELHCEAERGELSAVRRLLAKCAAVNAVYQGTTALCQAASHGHAAVVQCLIARGAAFDVGLSPIFAAAQHGHVEVVRKLVAAAAGTPGVLDRQDNKGRTCLWHASSSDWQHGTQIVQLLLDAGVAVDSADDVGMTPLHAAASCGRHEAVRLLLAAKAAVECRDSEGRTALMCAVQGRELRHSRWASTPAKYSSTPGHKAVVQELLAAGADVDAADNSSNTPLHAAVRCGHVSVIRPLLAAGPNVAATNSLGVPPLHAAASRGSVEIVELLLAAGASPSAPDSKGNTPLQLAAMDTVHEPSDYLGRPQHPSPAQHAAVVQRLAAAGAPINAANTEGMTPLHLAAVYRQPWTERGAVVHQLLQAGAAHNAADSKGRTPLHVANAGSSTWLSGRGRGTAAGRGSCLCCGPPRHDTATHGSSSCTPSGGAAAVETRCSCECC